MAHWGEILLLNVKLQILLNVKLQILHVTTAL